MPLVCVLFRAHELHNFLVMVQVATYNVTVGDVDLLLGTEQAVMLHSISTNIIIPCIFAVINVYLVAFSDVGHSDRRARWQSCMSCACNGSKYSKTLASLPVLVSIG